MNEGRKCEGCAPEHLSSSQAVEVCLWINWKSSEGAPAQGGRGAGEGMDRCGQWLIHEKQCSWCQYVESINCVLCRMLKCTRNACMLIAYAVGTVYTTLSLLFMKISFLALYAPEHLCRRRMTWLLPHSLSPPLSKLDR